MNVLGKGQKTKHPEQPIAKLNVPDARRVLPKGLPCLYLTIRQGILHEKLFQKPDKTFDEKERGRTMAFFTTAVTGLKTVVTAIGAGVGVWGVINLLEGYGNDNPGAKAECPSDSGNPLNWWQALPPAHEVPAPEGNTRLPDRRQ